MKSIKTCGVSLDLNVSRAMVNPLYFERTTGEYMMEPPVCIMSESSEAKTAGVMRKISVINKREVNAAFSNLTNLGLTAVSPKQYMLYYDLILVTALR
jgi:hypothetical protein